jgi:hypothetical protein
MPITLDYRRGKPGTIALNLLDRDRGLDELGAAIGGRSLRIGTATVAALNWGWREATAHHLAAQAATSGSVVSDWGAPLSFGASLGVHLRPGRRLLLERRRRPDAHDDGRQPDDVLRRAPVGGGVGTSFSMRTR